MWCVQYMKLTVFQLHVNKINLKEEGVDEKVNSQIMLTDQGRKRFCHKEL